jgi:F-type H+-transporting ATPase subunit delta
VSAFELTDALREKLLAALRKRLGADIRLLERTDPSLIGGLVLRFEGREIDGSFKSRLIELKQKLLR